MQKHNECHHLEGETLPINQQVYRVKVLTAFLGAAVPLNKLDCLKQLFEENGLCLTDRSHLANLIPFVLEEKRAHIKEEMKGKQVSVILDGTTHLGEAMAIVLRFVSEYWETQQRLVRLQMLAKSMIGEEITRELISTLSVQYGIPSNSLVATMRDRASVNTVAMRTMQVVYPFAVDVGCFSHMLNSVGEHFKVPLLSEFIHAWVSLFAHSCKAQLAWRERTGLSIRSYSPTRWWSHGKSLNKQLTCLETSNPSCLLLKTSHLSPGLSCWPFCMTQQRRPR